jgi:hypothetical protein
MSRERSGVPAERPVVEGEILGPADDEAGRRGHLLPAGVRRRLMVTRRPAVRRAAAVCAILVAVPVAVLAARPPPTARPRWAPVTGLSVVVPPVAPAGAPERPIVATYLVGRPEGGAHDSVTGLTGANVGAASIQTLAVADGDRVRVSAVPDCRAESSLDVARHDYRLTMARIGRDGRIVRGQVRSRGPVPDWAAAIRQACWRSRGATSLQVDDLAAEPRPDDRLVLLRVTLGSSFGRGVQVQAVDIADVDTIDPADTGVIRPGNPLHLDVRLPVGDCSTLSAPLRAEAARLDRPVLTWSIGPAGGEPAALVPTPLDEAAAAAISRATRRTCAPPATNITVTTARVLPDDPVVLDRAGVALSVRLKVTSRSVQVGLGGSQTGLTSDARVPITAAHLVMRGGQGSATVVWQARCPPAEPAPPLLLVRLGGPTVPDRYAVILDDATLAGTYARACGIRDRSALRAAGWSLP